MNFGYLKNTGSFTSCVDNVANLPYGATFVAPDGSQQILLQSALYIDADPTDGDYNEVIDYRPDYITPNLWRLECEDTILVVSDRNGLKYHIGNKERDILDSLEGSIILRKATSSLSDNKDSWS